MSRTDAPIAPPSRSGRPEPGPPRPYAFPRFSRARLPNGVEVIVARVARLPLVTTRVLIDGGAAADPLEQAGLTELTARALAEGTERADGARLTLDFERLGGALSTAVTWDGAHLFTTVLRERFAEAAALLAEVALTPTFPAREVERLRAERLAELLELRAEPRGLADEHFAAFVYDRTSRFALPEGGTESTVSALAASDCAAVHRARFRPNRATVIVVGDIEPERAVAGVAGAFGAWGGEAPGVPPVSATPARTHAAVEVVCRPGAPQSEIRAGHVGVPRLHPDYFDLVVMNAILGGVFNSRLNLNLRERHGYTYGVSTAFEWRREAGPFVVSTAVATEVTVPAVQEILVELERMRSTPPLPDELSLATSYLEGVFPIRFETTDAIAGALTALQVFRLPDDYYATYRARIRAVSGSAVLEAARRHLRPHELQIVVVGDPERIGPPLERAGVGPVTYRMPDEPIA